MVVDEIHNILGQKFGRVVKIMHLETCVLVGHIIHEVLDLLQNKQDSFLGLQTPISASLSAAIVNTRSQESSHIWVKMMIRIKVKFIKGSTTLIAIASPDKQHIL